MDSKNERSVVRSTAGLIKGRVRSGIDYQRKIRRDSEASFSRRWNSLTSRLRKAAEKSGSRQRDIPSLIADARSRERQH